MATDAKTTTPAASPSSWETVLLDLLGAPHTQQNYGFLTGWATREHGSSFPSSLYANNPFFTTAGAGGSAGAFKSGMYPSIPNTPGVAVYPSLAVGELATAQTLKAYPGIIGALKTGNPGQYASNPELQKELSTWSGGGYSQVAPVGTGPEGPVLSGGDTAKLEFIATGGASGAQGIEKTVTGLAGSLVNTGLGALTLIPGVNAGSVGLPNAQSAQGAALGQLSGSNWFEWVTKNYLRIAEMAGGGLLIVLGLGLVGFSAARSGPAREATAPVRTVTRTVTRSRSRRATASRQRASYEAAGARRAERQGFEPSDYAARRKARKPKRGQPGSTKLARGDEIPF